MLTGNSAEEISLFIKSITSKNMLPINIEVGITFLLFVPTISLARCGITRPIHPIVPATDIEAATMMVEVIRKYARSKIIFTPNDLASSSE